jgi:hypothetical protein
MAPWRADFEGELLRFPAGVHDDFVDAVGLVGQLIDKMVSASPAKKKDPDSNDGYREASSRSSGENDWVTL